MRFLVLGSLVVEQDGAEVRVGGHRQRSVLALLLMRRGSEVTAEWLCDEVWAGCPPPSATSTLHGYISRLRRAVDPVRIVSPTPGSYRFVPQAGDTVDADEFEVAMSRGQAALAVGDHERAAVDLPRASSLRRGPSWAGFEDVPSLGSDAARLEELHLLATEQRIECGLALGRHAVVVAELEEVVDAHPLRERPWAQLMVALYRSGRQADALRAYQRLRRILSEQLGIEPSPELSRLEQAVLLQTKDLDWRPAERALTTPLPTGTVTFVFTDVEGSTRLATEFPRDWPSLLETHRDALHQAVEAHGGHEVSTEGDGHFFVFERSSDAVAAALAGQKAMAEVSWPPGAEIRVRMGLHTGEATVVADDYVGVAVHRAARIAGAAHGGQVVASDSVVATAGDGLPDHAVFEDCGEHLLKDLRPMRLWRLRHPELAPVSTPLRSLSPARHNLPVQRTSFVGREAELRRLQDLLATPGVVTVCGPGGVGKTRLAVHAAASLLDQGAVAVAGVVELAPLREAEAIALAVASAFGGTPAPGQDPLDVVLAVLGGRRAVVVLDNCEHLVTAAATLATELVARAPRVTVLATSRESLGVEGESVLRLDPFATPADSAPIEAVLAADPVRLFAERASSVDSGFRLDEATAADVAAICRRVDGLPLAVELAAARARTLSVEQIRWRLNERFTLLKGDERSMNDRQRTLSGLIGWSYELLGPEEAAVFRRLGVFVGGTSVDAVEDVCRSVADPDDIVDLVDRLVGKSLVAVTDRPSGRRLVLLESVRAYAVEQLCALGEDGDVRGKHAMLFAALAAEARGALASERRRGWLERLDGDRDNLRGALEWLLAERPDAGLAMAGDLGWYWYHWGLFAEGRRWLEAALEAAPAAPTDQRARALTSAARLARYQDDFNASRRFADEAVALARQGASAVDLGWALVLLSLAGVRVRLGATSADHVDDDALETALESVEVLRGTDDRWALAVALFYLGVAGIFSRSDKLVLPALEESEGLFADLDDDWGVGGNVFYMGAVAMQRGDLLRAQEHIGDSVEIFRRSGDRWRLARALAVMAEVTAALGDDPSPFNTEAAAVKEQLGMA